MITNIFIKMLGLLLDAWIKILPLGADIPGWASGAVSDVFRIFSSMLAYFPFLSSLFITFGLTIALYTLSFSFLVGSKIFNKIRGSG